MIGIYDLPRFAMNNKKEMEASSLAGCFHCGAIFQPSEIKEHTDEGNTCLCPHCKVDAVIGNACGFELTESRLLKAKNYWFSTRD